MTQNSRVLTSVTISCNSILGSVGQNGAALSVDQSLVIFSLQVIHLLLGVWLLTAQELVLIESCRKNPQVFRNLFGLFLLFVLVFVNLIESSVITFVKIFR